MTTPPTDDRNTSGVDATTDGRSMRRERNVEAARLAAIELLGEGARPSLADIAERAGIATRSVYRYFGDAESAIADAVEQRINRAKTVFESEPALGDSMPFDERLAMLILRRLRLERLVEPISFLPWFSESGSAGGAGVGPSVAILDDEVRSAFAPELARHAGDTQLAGLLCGLFRLRSVRSMRSAFGDSDGAAAAALSRAVSAVFADAQRSSS